MLRFKRLLLSIVIWAGIATSVAAQNIPTIAVDSVEGEGTTFTIRLKNLKPAKETTP